MACTFSNLLENPYLALIFIVPDKNETLRIGGEARIVRDENLRKQMAIGERVPDFAIVIYVEQAVIHCPKCMIRSKLWRRESWLDNSALATVVEATREHGNLDMTVEELRSLAENDGWDRLY